MSKKARSRKKAPAIGPRIVRAWFDTVINPLLNGLEKEQQLLAQHNWTWEFSPPSLETIHRVHAYVDRNNLEHFTQHYPEVARAIEEHDQQQLLLLQHCQQLQSLIVNSVLGVVQIKVNTLSGHPFAAKWIIREKLSKVNCFKLLVVGLQGSPC